MFNLFKKSDFVMIVPRQSQDALFALGKTLVKMGAKSVKYAEETIVDSDNKPVYECIAVIVERMPVKSAAMMLGKWGKSLITHQKYVFGNKSLDIYV